MLPSESPAVSANEETVASTATPTAVPTDTNESSQGSAVAIAVVFVIAVIGIIIFRKMIRRRPQGAEQSKDRDIRDDFLKNAHKFTGLYEALYSACVKKRYRIAILGDWYDRTRFLRDSLYYAPVWREKLKDYETMDQADGLKRSEEMLRFVQNSGIVRCDEKRFAVNQNTYERYITNDGELIEQNTWVRVIQPYWRHDNTILEKGVIEKE